MANGNGNNINTDDAAAAAAAATATTRTTQQQQQQHLTGDGSGACGDAKLLTTMSATGTSATATATSSSSLSSSVATRSGNINDLLADLCLNGSSGNSSNIRGDYTNIRATNTAISTSTVAATTPAAVASTSAAATVVVAPSASSTFSFKHFLNSSGTITAPSSTVTSLDAASGSSTSATAATTSSAALQTSTGARPKVPQSASVSHMQPDLNGSGSSSSAASKMKRSPRFSSFDSQASLAEYAACGSTSCSVGGNARIRSDLRLEVDRGGVVLDDDDDEHVGLAQVRNSRLYDERVDDDIFPSAASNLQAAGSSSRYVPRSYSSYDMPPAPLQHGACIASSPRRRPAMRPNRLVLAATPKMKLDLPLDTSNVAGAASALPDFVQDHLPDAWCQEAHLSSPPNSPVGAVEPTSCTGAVGGGALLLPAVVSTGLPNATGAGPAANEASGSTVKMLPDFLSDGPILHSSQRLADVAIGLPSNPIDSPPQEADGSSMRQENERLQRELQETRMELSAQSRRAHELEQQLQTLTETRRRETLAAVVQAQNMQRLRRQVSQLESELFAMREGCEQVSTAGAGAAAPPVLTPGSSHSSSSNTSRPSRTQQLARDLRRAADNAEQQLRQLLSGAENLRQMATNLEQQQPAAVTPKSPNTDPFTDFN